MDPYVVALALLAAASWGAGSPLSKIGMERGGTPFQVALTVVLVSVVTYWSALLVGGSLPFDHVPWVIALFAVTGFVATGVARVLTFAGVDRLGSSVNSAALNTRPVWATLLAITVLGETITLQMGLGVLVTVAGLVTIAVSEGGDLAGWDLHHLGFPLAAALAFGAGNVVRRYAFTTTTITPLEGVALNETAGLVGLLAYLLVRNDSVDELREVLGAPREAYLPFVGSGLLNAFALFALFEALSRGRVVVVDPLSAPTSLFSILFAAVFLRRVERVTRRVLAGATLVVVGVVLITGPQFLPLA